MIMLFWELYAYREFTVHTPTDTSRKCYLAVKYTRRACATEGSTAPYFTRGLEKKSGSTAQGRKRVISIIKLVDQTVQSSESKICRP